MKRVGSATTEIRKIATLRLSSGWTQSHSPWASKRSGVTAPSNDLTAETRRFHYMSTTLSQAAGPTTPDLRTIPIHQNRFWKRKEISAGLGNQNRFWVVHEPVLVQFRFGE